MIGCGSGSLRVCCACEEESQVTIRRIIAWLVLLFVIFFIVTQPETAASLVRSVFSGIGDAVSALASFFRSLV